MPDIPNRAELEQRTADALKRLRGDQRLRLIARLGNPPDPANVSDEFWKEIEEEDRNAYFLLLLPIAVAGAQGVGRLFGAAMDDATARALVQDRVSQRAAQVARDATKHSREWIADKARPGEDAVLPDAVDLADVLGDSRTETQAITEITQAWSLGELDAVDAVREGELAPQGETGGEKPGGEEQKPPAVEILWSTEKDGAVCPICRPLDGQPESVWSLAFPDGPPSHPRCRCVLQVLGGSGDGKEFRTN